MAFKIFGMCKIVFNSIFRQSIKNTFKCLSSSLILSILHWTHNALRCFTKCPQDLLLIIIQTSPNSNVVSNAEQQLACERPLLFPEYTAKCLTGNSQFWAVQNGLFRKTPTYIIMFLK